MLAMSLLAIMIAVLLVVMSVALYNDVARLLGLH